MHEAGAGARRRESVVRGRRPLGGRHGRSSRLGGRATRRDTKLGERFLGRLRCSVGRDGTIGEARSPWLVLAEHAEDRGRKQREQEHRGEPGQSDAHALHRRIAGVTRRKVAVVGHAPS
jgi:hypothetical protein